MLSILENTGEKFKLCNDRLENNCGRYRQVVPLLDSPLTNTPQR